MNAITMDELSLEPVFLERRLERLSFRVSLVVWAEFISLAAESLLLVREMRRCIASCSVPPHFDECLARVEKAGQSLPGKIRSLYGRLPAFFWLTRRKAFQAADEWESLAEDVALIATAQRRATLDDLCSAADKAASRLPSWRDTDLFQ